MTSDEQEIRDLVKTWMEATKKRDAKTILNLMADDVVFLVPGKPPMRKSEFAAAAAAQATPDAPAFDGTCAIQEVKVNGDWAYLWSKLQVVVTPPHGGAPFTRSGHTLSILRKQNGRWLLARDANLLGPAAPTGSRSTPN